MDFSNIDISELSISEQFYLRCISKGVKVRESLEVMTQNPMEYNTDLLMKILDDNKETEYGQKYDFANIGISTHSMSLSFFVRYLEKGTDFGIIFVGIEPESMDYSEKLTENGKWFKDFNTVFKTIKLLEENLGSMVFDISLSNIFLDMSP